MDVWHALPPDRFEARFFTDRAFHAVNQPEQRALSSAEQLHQIKVTAGVVCVDDIYSTITTLLANGEVMFCSGFVHGRSLTEQAPVFVQEAAVLHAIRALREWILQTDQATLHHVAIYAGDALVCHQLETWFQTGRCHLQSTAASGLINDIQQMPRWLRTQTSLRPFRLPDSFEDSEQIPPDTMLFLGLAEHLRTVVIPQQGQSWRRQLPLVPLSKTELQEIIRKRHRNDELVTMKKLAQLGSISACIITYLELTREIVAEIWVNLENDRGAQTNLAAILSATRYQYYQKGRILHVKCPKRHCYHKDSFLHMLDCYNLAQHVRKGPAAVQFLMRVAKATILNEDIRRIPLPEELTPDARQRQAAPIAELIDGMDRRTEAPVDTSPPLNAPDNQATWHEELLGLAADQ